MRKETSCVYCQSPVVRYVKWYRKNNPTLCDKCYMILSGGFVPADGRVVEFGGTDLFRSLSNKLLDT